MAIAEPLNNEWSNASYKVQIATSKTLKMRTQEKLMKHILRRIEGSTAVRLELTRVTSIDFESIA